MVIALAVLIVVVAGAVYFARRRNPAQVDQLAAEAETGAKSLWAKIVARVTKH